jgi:hypothetical protein
LENERPKLFFFSDVQYLPGLLFLVSYKPGPAITTSCYDFFGSLPNEAVLTFLTYLIKKFTNNLKRHIYLICLFQFPKGNIGHNLCIFVYDFYFLLDLAF